MAAGLKTSKPDLVAIHRLEFYKKQKNWKFCTIERRKDEEKKKAAKNTKVTLNKTYSIETAPEDSNDVKTKTEEVQLEEQENSHMELQEMQEADRSPTDEKVDHLNEAFVDTENDDNVAVLADKPRQPIGPYNPKWSVQQWAEHCQLWNTDPTPSVQTDPNFVSFDPKHHVQDDPNYAPCGRNNVQNDLNSYLQCGPMQYVHNDPNDYVPSAPENHIQNDLGSEYCLQSHFNQPHLVQDCMNQPCQALRKPTQQCCIENSMIHNQVTEYETELLFKRRDPLHSGTNLPHGVLMDMKFREREQSASCDGQGWSRQTQVWSNRQTGWFEEISDIPQEAIEAMEALEVGDGDAVDGWAPRGAGDWLQAAKRQGLPRSDSLPSVSSESFSRGAALAPHSTALDVTALTETVPTVTGTQGTLEGIKGTSGTLPAPALAAAVVGHAAALAALLSEARRRDIQVAPPPVQPLYNFKEYPSRDVGFSPHTHDYPPPPYTPAPSSVYTHNPTTVHDIFVAGSFNKPDMCGQTEGRGRGRQSRVIAIEKGRPYRLK